MNCNNVFSLVFIRIHNGVGLYSLHHGEQTIGPCGREMVAEAYLFDEVEVGIEYFAGCMVAEDMDEEGNDALHDESVAVGGEDEMAVLGGVALYPHAALTAVDEVLFRLVFRVERFEVGA